MEFVNTPTEEPVDAERSDGVGYGVVVKCIQCGVGSTRAIVAAPGDTQSPVRGRICVGGASNNRKLPWWWVTSLTLDV